jgi:hypothetical protein
MVNGPLRWSVGVRWMLLQRLEHADLACAPARVCATATLRSAKARGLILPHT